MYSVCIADYGGTTPASYDYVCSASVARLYRGLRRQDARAHPTRRPRCCRRRRGRSLRSRPRRMTTSVARLYRECIAAYGGTTRRPWHYCVPPQDHGSAITFRIAKPLASKSSTVFACEMTSPSPRTSSNSVIRCITQLPPEGAAASTTKATSDRVRKAAYKHHAVVRISPEVGTTPGTSLHVLGAAGGTLRRLATCQHRTRPERVHQREEVDAFGVRGLDVFNPRPDGRPVQDFPQCGDAQIEGSLTREAYAHGVVARRIGHSNHESAPRVFK